MIYILESGEYSDYQYHVVMEGPDDLDVDAAFAEAKAASDDPEEPGHNRYPESAEEFEIADKYGTYSQGLLVAAMVKALEKRGAREVTTTAIHLGAYGKAELEVSES